MRITCIRFLAAALLASIAQAAEFTVLIFEPAQELALRSDSGPQGQQYWGAYTKFAGALGVKSQEVVHSN